jgi:hypothetical protein
LLMVLCHNVVCVIHQIHESGAMAMFPALDSCRPKKYVPAQNQLDWE